MSRRISLNARAALDAQASAEVEVALLYVTHPTFDAPVRVSSDPTLLLGTDPVRYGTRSSWIDGTPQDFLFVAASMEMPGDQEDAPAAAQIVLDTFDAGIIAALRGFTDYATAHLCVVLAETPDVVERDWLGLKIVGTQYTAGSLTVSLSRDPIEADSAPMDTVDRQRFPGLFR